MECYKRTRFRRVGREAHGEGRLDSRCNRLKYRGRDGGGRCEDRNEGRVVHGGGREDSAAVVSSTVSGENVYAAKVVAQKNKKSTGRSTCTVSGSTSFTCLSTSIRASAPCSAYPTIVPRRFRNKPRDLSTFSVSRTGIPFTKGTRLAKCSVCWL